MSVTVRWEGLAELRRNFRTFPQKFNREVKSSLSEALHKVWENIPGYPEEPPDSSYTRTGTLGKSIGVGISGQRLGHPDVFEVRGSAGFYNATLGTNLEYAPYVIGEGTQAAIHEGRWWTLDGTVLRSSMAAIKRIFSSAARDLATYLAKGR